MENTFFLTCDKDWPVNFHDQPVMYQTKRKRGEKHGTYISIVCSEDEGEEGHDEGEYDPQPHVLQTGLYTLLGHSLVIDYTERCV